MFCKKCHKKIVDGLCPCGSAQEKRSEHTGKQFAKHANRGSTVGGLMHLMTCSGNDSSSEIKWKNNIGSALLEKVSFSMAPCKDNPFGIQDTWNPKWNALWSKLSVER